jgi:hypothetical protein
MAQQEAVREQPPFSRWAPTPGIQTLLSSSGAVGFQLTATTELETRSSKSPFERPPSVHPTRRVFTKLPTMALPDARPLSVSVPASTALASAGCVARRLIFAFHLLLGFEFRI